MKIFIARNKSMEPCDICYENRPSIKFFYLSCCQYNKLCFYCLKKLTVPTCPYCRETIPNLVPKKKKKPSYHYEIEIYSSSRTERKQQRRLLKLEIHENDRIRNRMRSFSI